jgi:hypothetical protein
MWCVQVLKGSGAQATSLFAKNLQLSGFAVCFATVMGISRDWGKISEGGFFQGYDSVVVRPCTPLTVRRIYPWIATVIQG